MDLEKYDFESALEQGFKSLFSANELALRVADDIEEGELPDECISLEINSGGPNSDEHLNAEGNYDNYTGTVEIEIKSNRVAGGKGATNPAFDAYTVSGAGSSVANGLYVRNGTNVGAPVYTLSVGGTVVANIWRDGTLQAWVIARGDVGDYNAADTYYINWDTGFEVPTFNWQTSFLLGENPPPDVAKASGGIRNRHNQLVAMTRKTMEEIDALALSTHWSQFISPTKLKPTGTERENDKLSRITTLSYEMQFRIT